jgi:hypothetical protein
VSRGHGDLKGCVLEGQMRRYVLSNMNIPSAEGNFKESGKAVKLLMIKDYTTHMGYIDLSDRMANSYNTSTKTWKWKKKTILNSYVLYKCCGGNMTYEI